MFERVLIPLDGSERAEAILPMLQPLLRRADSEALLIQVAPYPAVSGVAPYAPVIDFEQGARDHLARLVAELSERGIRARGLVRTGPAAAEILDAIEEETATLVAMTTHGRSGVLRWAIGSVAEKVIRSSPVPVLALRSYPSERARSANLVPRIMFGPRRILVPVDGSDHSLGAAPAAIQLARMFEAEAILLRVHEAVETAELMIPPARAGVGSPPSLHPARLLGEVAIQRTARQFADVGVPAKLIEASGDPASRILQTAYETGADLIVMATHGRSGPTRWMLGSVSERVLRASELPMLIVRSPQLRR